MADALVLLTSLVDESGRSGSGHGALEGLTSSSAEFPAATTVSHAPTPLSMQVRETRRGADAQKGIKDNTLLVFSNLTPRLDIVYAAKAAEAPSNFEERINFWHRECGMRAGLKDRLHSLRIWANATRHHDDELVGSDRRV